MQALKHATGAQLKGLRRFPHFRRISVCIYFCIYVQQKLQSCSVKSCICMNFMLWVSAANFVKTISKGGQCVCVHSLTLLVTCAHVYAHAIISM